jgi:hypothetical protein
LPFLIPISITISSFYVSNLRESGLVAILVVVVVVVE